MKTVWRLITHKHDPIGGLDWLLEHGCLAVGWTKVGNIEGRYASPEEIAGAIEEAYPNNDRNNWTNGGHSLYDFCYSMKEGDLAILSAGGKRKAVMEVTG